MFYADALISIGNETDYTTYSMHLEECLTLQASTKLSQLLMLRQKKKVIKAVDIRKKRQETRNLLFLSYPFWAKRIEFAQSE